MRIVIEITEHGLVDGFEVVLCAAGERDSVRRPSTHEWDALNRICTELRAQSDEARDRISGRLGGGSGGS